jgi:hypothetical protein
VDSSFSWRPCAAVAAVVLSAANASAQKASAPDRRAVVSHASGTFDVKLNPQPAYDSAKGTPLARMSIDKQFHDDLDGTSIGEMLAAGTNVKGSAGYVAIELVTGTLQGRRGSFVLQHSGTMNRGAPELSVTVVPDSGTEELTGLAGRMTIKIEGGKHFYEFEYTLPPG